MALDQSKTNASHDDGYWSVVAEFIDRRDRGEPVDPAEFAKGDAVLARRLRDCLAGFGWLEQALSGSDSGPPAVEHESMPETIGEYSIIRELGRGGMGVVYEAVHQGLGRRVALKVLFDSAVQGRSSRERFLREAKTAASLHHTNIVPVFDVGSADGHLYFAMQLIDGQSLEELRVESRESRVKDEESRAAASPAARDSVLPRNSQPSTLNPQEVARLGRQAAEALAYAHARGVVHRDIKPSNLILDSTGTVWVADFGLARRPEDSAVTASGARVGTPRYMSPEQATAQWDSLDARTDIYSLGVTLYELLTGEPLFTESTPQQLFFQIIRAEPARPRRLNPRIPRDLETIVLKAMAKRPADRYGSAQQLADDLRRFLAHEPVQARRIGPAGRLIRWCHREPVVAAISLVSLMTLASVAGVYQVHLTNQRDTAIAATSDARRELADALFERARAVRATPEAGRRWLALDLLKQSAEIRPRPELSVEATRTLELFDVRRTEQLKELGGPASAVAFDSSSRRVAVAIDGDGPAVVIWDRSSNSISTLLAAPAAIHCLTFSPDGRRLSGTTERHVCVWDLDNAGLQVLPGGRSGLSSVAFSSDGLRLFGFAQGLCVWDVLSGKLEAKLLESEVEIGHVAISGDSRYLIAAVSTQEDSRAEILRWSLPDLRPLEPLRVRDLRPDPLAEAMGVLALAASPTGSVVAAACGDSRIRLWDVQTAKPLAVLEGHRAPPTSLAFTLDGEMLVSTDRFEVKLWDARDAVELATLIRPDSSEFGPLPALALSRDGTLATTGDSCQLWELATPSFHRVLARERVKLNSIAASPDGRWMAWAGDARLSVWNFPDNQLRHTVPLELRGEVSLTFIPDRQRVAVVGAASKPIRVYDVATGALDLEWSADPATAVAASPDGRELAVAHTDGVIRRWNLATGQVTGALVGHVGPVTSLAFSPDGQWLAAGNEDRSGAGDRTLHLWEVPTGKLIRTYAAHRTITFGVTFSSDGKRIASCGGDRSVKIWDTATGELLRTLNGHSQAVRSVAFNSDGSLLATCSLDGHVFIWEPTSGRLIADLTSRACGSLAGVTFSTDDRWVLGCGGPYRWTHTGPGAVEAWNLSQIKKDLSQLGMTWESNK